MPVAYIDKLPIPIDKVRLLLLPQMCVPDITGDDGISASSPVADSWMLLKNVLSVSGWKL